MLMLGGLRRKLGKTRDQRGESRRVTIVLSWFLGRMTGCDYLCMQVADAVLCRDSYST